MKKKIFLLVLCVFFTGCASNRAMTYFEKDEMYAKAVQYTKKCDIIYQDQVKVMFTAAYLNSVDVQYNDDYENFIISAYVVDSNEYNEVFSNNLLFEVLLNDTNLISIEPLSQEHEMFNHVPLDNPWTNYFLVKFNPVELELAPVKVNFLNKTKTETKKEYLPSNPNLKLQLNHANLGSCSVSFLEE